jgi:hypothetical protein
VSLIGTIVAWYVGVSGGALWVAILIALVSGLIEAVSRALLEEWHRRARNPRVRSLS